MSKFQWFFLSCVFRDRPCCVMSVLSFFVYRSSARHDTRPEGTGHPTTTVWSVLLSGVWGENTSSINGTKKGYTPVYMTSLTSSRYTTRVNSLCVFFYTTHDSCLLRSENYSFFLSPRFSVEPGSKVSPLTRSESGNWLVRFSVLHTVYYWRRSCGVGYNPTVLLSCFV